jgi:hypothetical protein
MLWFTGATGQEVCSTDGTVLGRLIDLSVCLNPLQPTPLVSRLLLQRRRGEWTFIDWDSVSVFEHDEVELFDHVAVEVFEPAEVSEHLESGELLLGRDVLDTQIVDVVGHRLARVADIAMTCTNAGELQVLAVEIGFGRVLERLNLARLVGGRVDQSIAWSDLHLTSDRGHLVQLGSAASAVHRLTDGDLAALVARLDLDAATEVLDVVGPERTAGAITHAPTPVGERLLRALPEDARLKVLSHMPEEHAHRWRRRIRHERPLRGRRFFRGAGWRHRHGTSEESASGEPAGGGDQ